MKTIWVIVITVIVAGGLVAGGTYYQVNKKSTSDKNSLQSQISDINKKLADTEKSLADAQSVINANAATAPSVQTPAATTAPAQSVTTSVTAGWKTYTSSTYGYSIKYPADWTAKDMHTTFGVQDTYGFEPPNTSANWIVTVNVDNSDQTGETIDSGFTGTTATFAGKTATKWTFGNGYQYQLQSNGKYFVITVEYNASTTSEAIRSIADQIALTFSLTS